jgi:hypothetical protein
VLTKTKHCCSAARPLLPGDTCPTAHPRPLLPHHRAAGTAAVNTAAALLAAGCRRLRRRTTRCARCACLALALHGTGLTSTIGTTCWTTACR